MDDCVIHSANLHGHATLKIFKVPSFFLNQDLFPNFFYLFTTNFACQQTRNGTRNVCGQTQTLWWQCKHSD